MGDISKNFSFFEFQASDIAATYGMDNSIPESVKPAIRALVDTCLQPLRYDLGVSIHINSGYRCAELNEYVNGSDSSQHRKGEAADIRSPFITPLELARRVVALGLPFDQLILYPTFVHISHKRKGRQRGQILYNRHYTGEKI